MFLLKVFTIQPIKKYKIMTNKKVYDLELKIFLHPAAERLDEMGTIYPTPSPSASGALLRKQYEQV